MTAPRRLEGLDLREEGVALEQIQQHEVVAGSAGDEPVVVGRTASGEYWAVSATCSHYGAPLGDGLFDGQTLRCPWHHARFDVMTGAAAAAPAFDAVRAYHTRVDNDRLFVGSERERPGPAALPHAPDAVVVVGGGAAGYAAIDELRARGYRGAIDLVSEDARLPYDRPNLSKEYLAGEAEEGWLPLREEAFYETHDVRVHRGMRVERIDAERRLVTLPDGATLPYDALLLATGSTPITLDIERDPGVDLHYLRSRRDADELIRLAGDARSAVVIGGSFIGTEVAASLRKRGLDVTIVDHAALPMAHVLGNDLGQMVKSVHEAHGVSLELGRTVRRITDGAAILDDGDTVPADLVIVGVGVRPNTELASDAGLAVDGGVTVDRWLRTSVPGIWAAGDIAAWPDARSGERIRVEHWVVAERQGQTVARNMLGFGEPFDEVPFFWSTHFDLQINYVGHASTWDEARWSGDASRREGMVSFHRDGRVLAVATVGRDRTGLLAEVALEGGGDAELERALGHGDGADRIGHDG